MSSSVGSLSCSAFTASRRDLSAAASSRARVERRARVRQSVRARAARPRVSAPSRAPCASSLVERARGGAHRRLGVVCGAERETRLGSVLTSLPRRLELYFARRSYRVTLWRAISAFFGFYLANVMTLSFGALGINDIVAGALSVGFYEIVTRIYYSSTENNKWLEFVNWFKVGYCYSLIADAFKLGS